MHFIVKLYQCNAGSYIRIQNASILCGQSRPIAIHCQVTSMLRNRISPYSKCLNPLWTESPHCNSLSSYIDVAQPNLSLFKMPQSFVDRVAPLQFMVKLHRCCATESLPFQNASILCGQSSPIAIHGQVTSMLRKLKSLLFKMPQSFVDRVAPLQFMVKLHRCCATESLPIQNASILCGLTSYFYRKNMWSY